MRLLFILIFCLALNVGQASALKSFFEDEIYFLSAKGALKAYEGVWSGSQNIYIKGKLLGNIVIDNNNILQNDIVLDSATVAKMQGDIMEMKAKFFVVDNELFLTSKDESNQDVNYKGYIKNNVIEWFRIGRIYAYDYTKDTFTKRENGVNLASYSVKPYLKNPANLMYLEYKGDLFKKVQVQKKLEINPEKLNISRLRI